MSTNHRKCALATVAAVLFIMVGFLPLADANQKAAYEKLELSMAVNGTDIATDTKVAHRFANKISEATGGNIKVNVFPNDQLAGGNATKGIEMASIGAVDLAAYATSTMSVLDERLLVGTIPWAFDSYKQARQVIDTTGGEYYKKILAGRGLTFLGSTHNGFRQISNSKRPVKTPDDVQGLKIRVPGGEVYIKFFKELGADPVAMSWSETFTAIQQKTIDGQENGFSVTNSAKMYEIQKYMTVWNYTYENYLFVASSDFFDSLQPQTQQLIRETAREACEWGRDLVEEEQETLKKKFTEYGMEIIELSPAQLVPFKETVAGLREYLKKKYGPEACTAFGL